MLDNKGQALIEFILILPVFLLLLFVIVDFGVIFSAKSNLVDDINSIKSLYSDYDISLELDNDYDKFIISYSVDLITPGMNRILSDPYVIKVERVISNA